MFALIASNSFAGRRVEVVHGDLTVNESTAIVCPANSYGTMRGGVAGSIRRAGGDIIEEESVRGAPLPLGSALLTGAGNLRADFVIHVPTMRNPVEVAKRENVRRAMLAVLDTCEENEIVSVAVPGMGTGTGGMPYKTAAEVMIAAIRDRSHQRFPALLQLVAYDLALARAWVQSLSGK